MKTIWNEDETEEWQVNADTATEAMTEVVTRLRFRPHHVEAHLCSPDTARGIDLQPGQVRRVQPQ